MPDREKVIKGLEYCIADGYCDDCPYTDDCFEIDDKPYGEQLMRDALDLLREQEPVEPIKPIDVDDSFTFLCSNCKGELFCGDRIRDKYCPTCGRVVKWDA